MPTDTASALRRLDTPGHDAAWLKRTPDGWLLQGTAVFRSSAAGYAGELIGPDGFALRYPGLWEAARET